MLDVFPAEIHGTILVTNLRLIYGAMLFKTIFLEAILGVIWDAFVDDNWDINWDANWDDNWGTNWDINCDANYRPK